MVFKFRKEINLFNLIYDSMVVCLNIAFYVCVVLEIFLIVLDVVYRNPISMFIEGIVEVFGAFVLLAVIFLITPLMCVIKTLFENKVIGMNCIKALNGEKLDDDNMYVTDDWFVIVTAEYFAVYNRKYIKKVQKTEAEIGNVKNESEKVDIKIDELSSNSSLSKSEKDKLFDELEKDILNLKSAVEKLKEENQNLKKELELLIEKNKVESQKSNLEKENSSLKDKLQDLKNKTQNLKNKITYKDKPESQIVKDSENLNYNQKDR